MSNNRYVILNCPTLMGNRLCYSKEIKQCADCTDCIMKQIVDILRENTCKPEECGNLKEENKQYKHLAEQHLKDYFECYKALEEIEEFCLVYRDNPVEGSAYKKILDIITKEKEQE